MSYGTYLMTVARRHPTSVRSIVLSRAFPLDFDMWARANARAVRRAIRLVCARSTTGRCTGDRSLRELGRLARRLRAEPILPTARRSAAPRRDRAGPDRRGPVPPATGPLPDVPVLVTSSDLDPNVPTAEGRRTAGQFAHAQVVEVPNAGHVPEQEPSGCAASITFDFIRNQRLGEGGAWRGSRPCPSADGCSKRIED
jgi:pimeloyl-ACP methyl ester carboxylesterase